MKDHIIQQGYEYAREVYLQLGVDTEAAINLAKSIPISMNCWQGDDLIGFDGSQGLTGGISSTGNYIGRARSIQELQADIDFAISLIPGRKKINLHACYAELNGKIIGRDEYSIEQFSGWLSWAKENGLGIDFNPTFFSHPMMDGNFSLASNNPRIRRYWIEHSQRCLEIGQEFGKALGKICVVNFWMPDGYKDVPVDTKGPRALMTRSLDEVFSLQTNPLFVAASIESKLFGLGLESYTVANHEFSLGYALSRNILYCMDAGHFHPTEVISEKLSSVLSFLNGVYLHISRGVRWDSDHVVLFDDELKRLMCEIVKGRYMERVHIGQDYFDASINRITAWVVGMRNTQKALLSAFLQPTRALEAEQRGDFSERLAYLEEAKTLPFSAVWDYYCALQGIPTGSDWIEYVKKHEDTVLSLRQ